MPKQTYLNLSDDRKSELMEAVKDIYFNWRYDDIHVSDLVKQMNIPVGSFYRYFEDKDDATVTFFIYYDKKYDIPMEINHIFEPIEPTKEEKEQISPLNNAVSRLPLYIVQRIQKEGFYDKVTKDYKKYLTKLKYDQVLRNDLDVDLISFMYATTTYNLEMYFREFNIYDQDLRWKIKKYFFFNFFKYGIMGKEDEIDNKK